MTPAVVPGPAATAVRANVGRLRHELERAGAGLAPVVRVSATLRRLEARLARTLRIAIAGEFNSGKSSLANLLAGVESLPTAVVSNTAIPTLLYFAARPEIFARTLDGARLALAGDPGLSRDELLRLEVGLPAPRLTRHEVLDLPGLADPNSDASVGELVLHGIDAVIWCTVCTQAWRESERAVWAEAPPRLASRAILVATHRDLLQGSEVEAKLAARLARDAGDAFGDIVLVSTSEARATLSNGIGTVRATSDMDRVDAALDRLLGRVARERGEAALAVARRLAAKALAEIG